MGDRYKFDCECIACDRDWDNMKKLKGLRFLKCPACFHTQKSPLKHGDYEKCEKCPHKMDVQKALQGLAQCFVKKEMAFEHLKAGRWAKARQQAVELMKILQTFVGMPDYELLSFREDFITIIEHALTHSSL